MNNALLFWGAIALLQVAASFAETTKYRFCVVEVPKSKKYGKYCPLLDQDDSKVSCVKANDRMECLMKLSQGKADFAVLEAEDIVVASNSNDILITNDIRFIKDDPFAFEVVAIVRNSADIAKLSDLHDKDLCHPGYSLEPQWTEVISRFFEARVVPQMCNETLTLVENRIRSSAAFFRAACKAGNWVPDLELDADLKLRYPNLCQLCDMPNTCSAQDKYWGRQGPLFCLTDGVGDVSWSRLGEAQTHFKLNGRGDVPFGNPDEYSFLCENGTVQPLTVSEPCVWLARPWPAVAATKRAASEVQNIVANLRLNFPAQGWEWALDRLMSDSTAETIVSLPSTLTPGDFLQRALGFASANSLSDCTPGHPLKICTSSQAEFAKCSWMKEAARAYGVDPELECSQAKSVQDCMKVVQGNAADAVVVRPDFELAALRDYNLKPLIYEFSKNNYNLYNTVAVVKENSPIKTFEDLRGRKACFPSYEGIGWTSVINYMRSKSMISNKCPYSESIAEFFSESCVPGLDKTSKDYREKLRALCKDDAADDLIVQNDAAKFRGDQGAFRCLASGVGDVAFIDLATIRNNSDGANTDSWAINLKTNDFRTICANNSNDQCNLSWEAPGIVMIKNGSKKEREMEMYITFLHLDDLFGKHAKSRKPAFQLFGPFNEEKNVMFQDTTQRLEGLDAIANYVPGPHSYERIINDLPKCAASRSSLPMLVALFSIVLLYFV